eukprot:gnl/Trimastix_PCT/1080.p1 GENE.gnl/Trimastix_PCT/1080~~gnl/Trimastix_PCT/1080.p1  ORF type:complete len:615 (-),score=143.02 gnl/Trimastix_PCT/1080:154-1998(-)
MKPKKILERTREELRDIVWAIAFRPDGKQMVVAVGSRLLVFDLNSSDQRLAKILTPHKGHVFALSYSSDGKRFASGGADCTVIIWTAQADGLLQYTHGTSIQALAYNPVTQQLASGTENDIGLWSPEQKQVQKERVNSRILCMAWTNDGQFLACGQFNGIITIRDRSGAVKHHIRRPEPVWCLAWNPAKDTNTLAVGSWDQRLSFYNLNGKQEGGDHVLGFDPCSLSYFTSGEYLVIGGSNCKALLYTRDGVKLSTICESNGWIWSAVARPKHNYVATGSNDCTLSLYQLVFTTVHGLYQLPLFIFFCSLMASLGRYQSRSDHTESLATELSQDLVRQIRGLDLVPVLSEAWIGLVERVQRIASIALMEQHLPGAEKDSTLWEVDQLTVRYLVEESKLNMCLRGMADYFQVKIRAFESNMESIQPAAEAHRMDVAELRARMEQFEFSMGLLLECAFQRIEALQIVDMHLLLEHMHHALLFAQTPGIMAHYSLIDKSQPVLCTLYLFDILSKIDNLSNDSSILSSIAERKILPLIGGFLSANHLRMKAPFVQVALHAIVIVLDHECFDQNMYFGDAENRDMFLLLQPIVNQFLVTHPTCRSKLLPLTDMLKRLAR